MQKILFATSNNHKLREVKEILPDLDWLSLADFPKLKDLDPEETGNSFEENAQIKAIEYGEASDILTLAEDSGLEVTALNGEPGVRSARWIEGSDQDRFLKLLDKMTDQQDRSARYISTLCLYDPQTKKLNFFTGEIRGKIIDEPRGTGGFGYDPIFVPEGEQLTFSELDMTDNKHQHSHRKRSLDKLSQWWR